MQIENAHCSSSSSFVAEDRLVGFAGIELRCWSFREARTEYLTLDSELLGVGPSAGNAHKHLLAFVERRCHPRVFVYSFEESPPKLCYTIENTTTLDLAQLAFSRDGSRLYTLSKASSCDLMGFSMEDGKLLTGCQVQFTCTPQELTVSPHDLNILAVINRAHRDIRCIRLEKVYDRIIPHTSGNIVPVGAPVTCYSWTPKNPFLVFVTDCLYIANAEGGLLFSAKVDATQVMYFTVLHLVMHHGTKVKYWQYEDLNTLELADSNPQELEQMKDSPFRLRKVGTLQEALVEVNIAPDFRDAIGVTEKGDIVRFDLPAEEEVEAELTRREAEDDDRTEEIDVAVKSAGWHHRGAIRDVAFVVEGQASVDATGCCRIWNHEASKTVQFLHGTTCVVACGDALVVGSESGCLRLVSVTPLQTTFMLRLCEAPILSVCAARKGDEMVVSALTLDERIFILTVEDNARVVVQSVVEVPCVAHYLAPSGLEILAVGSDETPVVVSIECGASPTVRRAVVDDNVELTCVCRLDENVIVGDVTGRLCAYATPRDEPAQRQWVAQVSQALITCLVPTADGVVCGCADGSVVAWKSGATMRVFSRVAGVVALDWRDGRIVACDEEAAVVLRESDAPPSEAPFRDDGACFVDAEDEFELALWSPCKEETVDVATDDDIPTQQLKRALIADLDVVRKNLHALVEANDNCSELEVLDRREFCVDWEERDRIAQLTRESCDALESQIKKENLEREMMRCRLVKEFWDPMKTPGTDICSLSSELKVSNYPTRARDGDEKLLAQVRQFREIEALEAKWQRAEGLPRRQPETDAFSTGAESYIVNCWAQGAEGVKEWLYAPFELVTDVRRRTQMVFLREMACDIRHQFNARFTQMQGEKKNTMGSIADRVGRIHQILDELGQDKSDVVAPTLGDSEIAELVLKAKDGEVLAEKWISPEDQAILDAARVKEEARLRKLRENDAGARAIQSMMGGTLKTKKDLSPLEMTLDREEWMNLAVEDMTDAQKVLFEEFEAKEKALGEEQAKYRTQLESEHTSLKQAIVDAKDAFEEKLKTLHHDLYRTDFRFFCQELYFFRLMLALLRNIADEEGKKGLEQRAQECEGAVAQATRSVDDFEVHMRAETQKYEEWQRRERDCVHGFKSFLASSGLETETTQALNKLFRAKASTVRRMNSVPRRPSNLSRTASGLPKKALDIVPFSPFETTIAAVAVADTLEETAQTPVVDESVLAKMWQCRRERMALERQGQEIALVLNAMGQLHEWLKAQKEQAERVLDDVAKELEDHLRVMSDEAYNFEILLELKQGQVEVQQAAIVTDYSDAIMLDTEVVESRNRRIVELGAEKVGILSHTREFRKKLNLVDWEHKLLNLQTVDLEERTKDVHMLRVTKDRQRLLNGEESQTKAEVDMLERKIEHTVQTASQKELAMRKVLMKVQHEMRSRKAENAMLDKRLRELQTNVMQREHIKRLRAAPTGANKAPGARKEKRNIIGGGGKIEENESEIKQATACFRDIEQRRNLIDTSEKQKSEIEVLRKELDRLRQKTFPSFVHLHGARIANADG